MLTPRRQRFCEEYLIDLCATRAAIRAGYSSKTANVQGPRLMKNPEVRAAIKVGMDKRARRINIRADDVLSEISRVALHRIVVGLGTSFAPAIRTQSKQKALDQLARHLGPYSEKVRAACCNRFVERVQASSVEVPVPDSKHSRPAVPSSASGHCDWLPPDGQAPQPSSCGHAAIDYDPTQE